MSSAIAPASGRRPVRRGALVTDADARRVLGHKREPVGGAGRVLPREAITGSPPRLTDSEHSDERSGAIAFVRASWLIATYESFGDEGLTRAVDAERSRCREGSRQLGDGRGDAYGDARLAQRRRLRASVRPQAGSAAGAGVAGPATGADVAQRVSRSSTTNCAGVRMGRSLLRTSRS